MKYVLLLVIIGHLTNIIWTTIESSSSYRHKKLLEDAVHQMAMEKFIEEAKIEQAKQARRWDSIPGSHYVAIRSTNAAFFKKRVNDSIKVGYVREYPMSTFHTNNNIVQYVQILVDTRK